MIKFQSENQIDKYIFYSVCFFVVSFYGDSYLNLFFGINKDVELRVRFLIWQFYGFFFLVRGFSDYLYLYFQDGCVQVEVDFGFGFLIWKFLSKIDDGNWYYVELKQVFQLLIVIVDGVENQIDILG